MPQIDVYTAQTKPAVPDQPFRFVQSGENPAAQIQKQGQALGQQFDEVAGRINQQTADLQFLDRKYRSENDTAAIRQEVERMPEVIANPQLYEAKFLELKKVREDVIAQSFTNSEAKSHYEFYREHQEEADFIAVRGHGLKLQDVKNQADFIQEEDRLSDQAAEAINNEEFEANIQLHQNLVTNAVANGTMTPKQGEDRLLRFRQAVGEKNMMVVGARNPMEFRMRLLRGDWPTTVVSAEKKEKALEHFNSQERIKENAQNEQTKKVQELYYWSKYRLAMQGLLPDTEYQEGVENKDPMMPDPTKWRNLKIISDKAAAGGSSGLAGVAAIRIAFDAIDNPTIDDWRQAKASMTLFLEDSNPDLKTMNAGRQALEFFQRQIDDEKRETAANIRAGVVAERQKKTDLRLETSEKRTAERDQEHALDRKIDLALSLYTERNNKIPIGRGVPKTVQENKIVKQKAAVKNIYNKNPQLTPEEVVDRVLGKNVGTVQQGPSPDADAIDFLTKD